jgi:hypothetical protein
MSTSGDKEVVSLLTTVDASASQYKIVDVNGTIAANNATAIGVLLNKPKSGENASVAYSGHMKAYAGAAIAAGAEVVVTTSGYLITNATSVSGIVGKALTAASSGALVEFLGSFQTTRNSYSTGII